MRTFTADLFVKDIPALGYKTLRVERSKNPNSEENPFGEPYFPYKPIVCRDGSLNNGRLKVTVNPDCTLRIEDLETGALLERTHILRDSGDAGNVWVNIEPSFNRIHIPLASSASCASGKTPRYGVVWMSATNCGFRWASRRIKSGAVPITGR